MEFSVQTGGNVTASSTLSSEVSAKQLELLTDLLPGMSRVAVMSTLGNPWHPIAIGALEAAAPQLGIGPTVVSVRDRKEVERSFADIARNRFDAVMVLADPMMYFHRAMIAQLGIRHLLPTVFGPKGHVEAGGLMSYWADSDTLFRRTAGYVDKILKGANVAQLPIEQPTKYELAIHLGTARALGIDVPPAFLARADEVIE